MDLVMGEYFTDDDVSGLFGRHLSGLGVELVGCDEGSRRDAAVELLNGNMTVIEYSELRSVDNVRQSVRDAFSEAESTSHKNVLVTELQKLDENAQKTVVRLLRSKGDELGKICYTADDSTVAQAEPDMRGRMYTKRLD